MTEQSVAVLTAIEQLEAQWLWFLRHSRRVGENDLRLFARFLPDFRSSFALRTLEQTMLLVARNRAVSDPIGEPLGYPEELSPIQRQLWLVWSLAQRGPIGVPE